jgi:mRNA interferase MazF
MHPRPAEVWLADLGLAAKTRPVVIVSREDQDAPRALAIYVPLTTQERGSEYEVALGKLPILHQASCANVQGIGAIPFPRLERKVGVLPAPLFAKVKAALRFALDLE